MKLKYSHEVAADIELTTANSKYCEFGPQQIIVVHRESAGAGFHAQIIDIEAGVVSEFSFSDPSETSSAGYALALLSEGTAAVFVGKSIGVLTMSGHSGWNSVGGHGEDVDGLIRLEGGLGDLMAEGSPSVAGLASDGSIHVYTLGLGLFRCIISAAGSIIQPWTAIDYRGIPDGPSSDRDVYYQSSMAPPIYSGGRMLWAAQVTQMMLSSGQRLVTIDDAGSITVGAVSGFGQITSEPKLIEGGIQGVNGAARQMVTVTAAGVSTSPIVFAESPLFTINFGQPSFVMGSREPLGGLQIASGGLAPSWGYFTSDGTVHRVKRVDLTAQPSYVGVTLSSGYVAGAASMLLVLSRWINPAGVRYLRQRQTLTANNGSWPLRQKQNGGATGSWPLRQRQAA